MAVLTAQQAIAQGISASRLRSFAAWSFEAAAGSVRAQDHAAAERHRGNAAALLRVADEVERVGQAPVRRSRRHAA